MTGQPVVLITTVIKYKIKQLNERDTNSHLIFAYSFFNPV